ncbi:unnamed protein product, partial [Lepidochelys olivacea]
MAHSSTIRPGPGPAYWHFNNSLLEDESFVMSFREFWLAWREQWRAFPSVRRWWDLGKVRAKLFCRNYTRERRLTGLVLREPELRLVLSAYADDVLLVVQDPGDLARVEACQAIFSAASSARVNWVKSS